MKSYLKILEESISNNWDSTFLCNYSGETFTHGSVAVSIAKFHIFFEKAGIKPGDHICLCGKNTARWAISFLSINSYGAVVVPLLSDFTVESIQHLTNHSDSVILFTDTDIWAKMDKDALPGIRAVVSVNEFTLLYSADKAISEAYETITDEFNSRYPVGFERENVKFFRPQGGELAIINYTSGTTSAPKGVMIRYESIDAMIEFSISGVHLTSEDSIVSMLPMGHIYGLMIEFIFPACMGSTIYYLGKTPSPTLLIKALKEVRPKMIATVPLVMEKIYKSNIKPLISKFPVNMVLWMPFIGDAICRKIGRRIMETFGGRVEHIIMGGAALNPEADRLFKRGRLPYCVGYGMTEASPLLAYSDWRTYKPGSCGRPVSCCEIRIDSEDPHHIAGEIQARGVNICSGYFKNPEASSNAFTEDGWFRTGDLGISDREGNIFIKGRSKTMILSANGQNIYPEELEAVINSQPYVAESVVVDRNSKLVALVYLDKDAIRKDSLDEETVSDIPENIRINSNRIFPSYSRLAKVEIMLKPFEKTPKMSIKRFLYK